MSPCGRSVLVATSRDGCQRGWEGDAAGASQGTAPPCPGVGRSHWSALMVQLQRRGKTEAKQFPSFFAWCLWVSSTGGWLLSGGRDLDPLSASPDGAGFAVCVTEGAAWSPSAGALPAAFPCTAAAGNRITQLAVLS